ncbi:hypothetical protein BJ684DRAFT_19652 [Piptocephalis cylindrospora]|uniref:Uncharacterized protein n=1 Tax=Piptocephalis cylindrospora TaxID=1907219 RepID=A0A4P9Y4P8_9FUNG|nr:hypothetical protein BJ684DRAFT_20107 [Piptocephalis cylindrospora]RKP13895.1 hypothetical protein BJ684DRAFT_19652 [Piptocephalis cylindrospora]|eukprot:RKP13401.1 hypothetical protein BJ684DRAFT_20107 [Piptocephalis cylindrospora]
MKLTSILLISAMLAMTLTVASSPTPTKDDYPTTAAVNSDFHHPPNYYNENGVPREGPGRQEILESLENTVDGDGRDPCHVGPSVLYDLQCWKGYKCKATKVVFDSAGARVYDFYGTCVRKIDETKN